MSHAMSLTSRWGRWNCAVACACRLFPWTLTLALAAPGSTLADALITFPFTSGLTPSQQVQQVSMITPFTAAFSSTIRDSSDNAVRADTWTTTNLTNYIGFAFAIEPGYLLDIEGLQFDYKSEKILTFAYGPTQYNVFVGIEGASFESVSGGWKPMPADNTWHRNVTATNDGVVLSNLQGQIRVAFAAKDARNSDYDWYLDNVIVQGHVRANPLTPVAPTVVGYQPGAELQLQDTETSQYYSLQFTPDLASPWRWDCERSNLRSTATVLEVAADGITGFVRTATSYRPMPSVDMAGFWSVSSTGGFLRRGVMRILQREGQFSFEGRLLGVVTGNTFRVFEDGVDIFSGAVTGSTLRGSYAFPFYGIAATGDYEAVIYDAPLYEVWQGTQALTTTQFYNPGSNGYEKVGEASTTTTFALNKSHLLICANTLAPVDALQGSTGAYVGPGVPTSMSLGNASDYTNFYGPPDGVPALVGNGYPEQPHRGFAALWPLGWTSVTVYIAAEP